MRLLRKLVVVLLLCLVGWGAALFALGTGEYLTWENGSILSRFTSLFTPGDWFALLVFHELKRQGATFSVPHPASSEEPYWGITIVVRSAKDRDDLFGVVRALFAPLQPFGVSWRETAEVLEVFLGERLWFRFHFHLRKRFQVAIVIDDIGYDPGIAEALFDLPVRLNIAILPYAPYGPLLARRAKEKNHEVLIHFPMEALAESENGQEPFLLRVGTPEAEIVRLFEQALKRVPGARGLNNHKGSKATQSKHLMELLALRLREHGLYFLDSLTTPRSVAFRVMEAMGVPALRRDVFLDGETDVAYVLARLRETLAVARQKGFAVAIGHPKRGTYEALRKFLSESHPEYEFVVLSEILQERSRK